MKFWWTRTWWCSFHYFLSIYYCTFNLRWSHLLGLQKISNVMLNITNGQSLICSFFFQAEKASPTLTLSHSELTQIRSALSRAKLESLPPDLMNDIVKGNLCFLCTKTKFMMFLNRRHQCQLCQQSVCSKCISKVCTHVFSCLGIFLTPFVPGQASGWSEIRQRSPLCAEPRSE